MADVVTKIQGYRIYDSKAIHNEPDTTHDINGIINFCNGIAFEEQLISYNKNSATVTFGDSFSAAPILDKFKIPFDTISFEVQVGDMEESDIIIEDKEINNDSQIIDKINFVKFNEDGYETTSSYNIKDSQALNDIDNQNVTGIYSFNKIKIKDLEISTSINEGDMTISFGNEQEDNENKSYQQRLQKILLDKGIKSNSYDLFSLLKHVDRLSKKEND